MDAAKSNSKKSADSLRTASQAWLSGESFWYPEFIAPSAWIEHAPYAFWLIAAMKPKSIVELGTHGGFSYFSFCQAVKALGLDTQCYAVDTWAGDSHAGFYGEDIFERVNTHNRQQYSSFSRLVRSTFDDALPHFADGSVDLLHIDGQHYYEDVRHDFEGWRSKLTDSAVVLFHDTNVRERNFGVFKLWSELKDSHPSFEFFHGHGLGVLGPGSHLNKSVAAFFKSVSRSSDAQAARYCYSRLGAAIQSEISLRKVESRLDSAIAEKQSLADELVVCREAKQRSHAESAARIEELKNGLADQKRENGILNTRIAELEARISTQRDEHAASEAKIERLAGTLTGLEDTLRINVDDLASREAEANALRQKLPEFEARLKAVYASRSWRVTSPFRAIHRSINRSVRQTRNAAIETARWAYRRTPLPRETKTRIKIKLTRSVSAKSPSATYKPVKAKKPRLAYGDFLRDSLFNPQLKAPYDERGNYYIAFMASYERYLAETYRDRPQSDMVSIVMPTFNRAHCISDAIRSLDAQSYLNWELIIVDDCGTDETGSVVESFADSRIKYQRLESNRGASGARNAAIEQVSGDLICYLDSDNTLAPNYLLILVNELKEHPEFDLVYCAQRAFDTNANEREELFVRFAPFHRPSLENRNYIDLGAIMHRRSIFENFGVFNSDMRRLVDWEFLLRQTGERGAWAVPAILSNYVYDKSNNQLSDTQSYTRALARVDECIRAEPIASALPGVSLDGVELMYSVRYPIKQPSTRRPVSIVIPSYEAGPYLNACVEALQRFTGDHEVELIVVDNASGPLVVRYLEELSAAGRAQVLFNEQNLGFTFAVNQGIEVAKPGNDIIVMNNDAIVTRGWLDALQTVLTHYPEAGLVVPGQVVLGGEKTLPIHQPHRARERECDINISAHHENVLDPLFDAPNGYMKLRYAPFFCVYIPRTTLDFIGPLDVENGPHYRSDRLYCDMVNEVAGRPIIYTPHSKIYHFVQRATKDLSANDSKLYRDMFVENDWRAVSAPQSVDLKRRAGSARQL